MQSLDDALYCSVGLVIYGENGKSGLILLGRSGERGLFRAGNQDQFKVRSVPEKLFSLIIEIRRHKYVHLCIFAR